MAKGDYTEDSLVQQTTADYLRDALRWEVVYAYNDETFGPEGLLGRKDDREVVLTRDLGEALARLRLRPTRHGVSGTGVGGRHESGLRVERAAAAH